MANKPAKTTAYYQDSKFPRNLLERIDVTAKMLGITREQVVIDALEIILRDVEKFADTLRKNWQERLRKDHA